MDLDPMEYAEAEKELEEVPEREKSKSRLNALVAITVAILATFMGICKIKDDNIVQQMQQDQAKSVDAWSWYQAKKTRMQFAGAIVDELEVQAASASAAAKPLIDKKIASQKAYIDKEQAGLKDVQDQAKGYDKDYDSWNFHDDQFDMSDASLALAISLLALTSLTQKKWLYGIAMVPTVFGLVMGLSGLFGFGIHPNVFAKWLGT